jgi:maltooligosyltrehalose trehalohydrolase
MQNHDQVGNRAVGDRIAQQMNNLDRQKVGAALTILSPFVPLLFQGEEWAASSPFQYFSDMQNPSLRHAIAEGRKEEFASFGWNHDDVPDPTEIETFNRSKLVWEELDRQPHRDMVQWYRQLIALRKKYPDLSTGHMERVQSQHDARDQWIILCRDRLTIVANLSERTQTLPIDPWRPTEILLASSPHVAVRDGGLEIPSNTAAVLGPKE